MQVVEFYKDYNGEHPFEIGGQKYVYCWGKYPTGKVDVAVYSYANDLAYDYNDFRAAHNMSEGYQQPKMFMDIKETLQPQDPTLAQPQAQVSPDQFEDDPTIGEMIAKHEQEQTANDAVMGQYDLGENFAPEAKEFMGTEKLQSAGGENGLAGAVENGGGDKAKENEIIKSLLDRMKQLSKINTEKPNIQFDGVGTGLVDTAKEVAPDDVVRSEKTTGAPSIEILKQELRPENPIITKSAPKADGSSSSSSSTPKAEKSDAPKSEEKGESQKPWEKKEEAPAAAKDETKEKSENKKEEGKVTEKDEDKPVEEVTTHNIAVSRRQMAGNDREENINEGVDGEDLISEALIGFTDQEILESESTELMYEAMVKYKNDPENCLKFKRRLDEVKREQRLSDAIAKMRRRF